MLGPVLMINNPGYIIRQAIAADAPLLPPVERSAAALFATMADLAWVAEAGVMSVERHLELIAGGGSWVADAAGIGPVAFLCGEPIDGAFHIWEMSVHAEHQRRGLGARLLAAARQQAIPSAWTAITLTTFRDIAWNEPFYCRSGFCPVEATELSGALAHILDKEVAAGLPHDRRIAMIMHLPGGD